MARSYPGDAFAPSGALALWRAVTVHAPPPVVWSCVRQLRVAPYSYDLVDNMGRRSPQQLLDLPEPRVGGPFSRTGGVRDVGRVLAVEPGVQLTATVLGVVMSYVVVPHDGVTRLLLKVVLPRRTWWSTLLAVADLPMARRQLLSLKRLAEQAPERPDRGPGPSP